MLDKLTHVTYNHIHPELLNNFSDRNNLSVPLDFQVKHNRVHIGQGPDVYRKASDLLLSFRAINRLPWVKVIPQRGSDSSDGFCTNATIATHAQTYNLPVWSLNPCRIVSFVRNGKYNRALVNDKSFERKGSQLDRTRVDLYPEFRIPSTHDRTSGVYSEVVFSTLTGHLLAGAEAFRVYTEQSPVSGFSLRNVLSRMFSVFPVLGTVHVGAQDKVTFEIVSFSKGSSLIGRLCMPLIRPLQDKFMRDSCVAMQNCMNAGSSPLE